MKSIRLFYLALILFLLAVSVGAANAKAVPYQTGFDRWRAADNAFAGWTLTGTELNPDGTLTLDLNTATPGDDPYTPGSYYGGNYYNGSSFLVGAGESPAIDGAFDFREAIASWNASTPAGSWIEIDLSLRFGSRWSKPYVMGIWAEDNSTIQRHSVSLQGDGDAYVAIDTLVVANKKAQPDGYKVMVKLFSADGLALPTLRNVSVALSITPPSKIDPSSGNPANWNTLISVPECSQMVYPDGGEVWCSPTSTAMALKYWQQDWDDCEPDVLATVAGVYDWRYDGHGNWPFNTAYAAAHIAAGDADYLEGYVLRFTSLDEVEPLVAAGTPVIASLAWKKNSLEGAPIPRSAGHLLVIVGFDAGGNPIVNDPAAATNADVTRIYMRGEFEKTWLSASGGTVYVISPP